MAKKKKRASKKATPRKKKTVARRKPAPRKKTRPVKKKASKKKAAKKPARKKAPVRKAKSRKKAVAKKAPARKLAPKKAAPKAKAEPKRAPTRRPRGRADTDLTLPVSARGLGADSGGQSGDNQGLSNAEVADSESVDELVEEGQAYEAGIVDAVENAPDADKGPIRTREVPEDDVPQEYLDED
jgi:hypothetical protein